MVDVYYYSTCHHLARLYFQHSHLFCFGTWNTLITINISATLMQEYTNATNDGILCFIQAMCVQSITTEHIMYVLFNVSWS